MGDANDSMNIIKQTAEKFLDAELRPSGEQESKTVYEMRDKEGVAIVKIWMKSKKTVVGGNITTTYSVSSFKITGIAEKIDILLNALKEKVAGCSIVTGTTVVFGSGKMSVEKQGGDWSKQNLPMATLTVTGVK